MRPADLQLDLDSFAGPFDLLCTVLLRRELPLDDVPLAEVVVGYVQQLAQQERVNPDTASEFLLLVAALMEIKVRELLASEEAVELVEPLVSEAQADLLERLLRYATFRNAAAWLGREGAHERYWRVAARPVIRRQKSYDGPVLDPELLRRRMQVLLAQPDVDVRHLVGKHASVQEMTGRMLGLLRKRRTFRFEEAVEGLSRLDQAVAFVAALELCKNGHLQLQQSEAFGPIEVCERDEAVAAGDGEQGAGQDGAAATETEFQIA
jgi:segregation and condensation protein A